MDGLVRPVLGGRGLADGPGRTGRARTGLGSGIRVDLSAATSGNLHLGKVISVGEVEPFTLKYRVYVYLIRTLLLGHLDTFLLGHYPIGTDIIQIRTDIIQIRTLFNKVGHLSNTYPIRTNIRTLLLTSGHSYWGHLSNQDLL